MCSFMPKRSILQITVDALKKEESRLKRKVAKYRIPDLEEASNLYIKLRTEVSEKIASGVDTKDMIGLLERASRAEKAYFTSLEDKNQDERMGLEFELRALAEELARLEMKLARGDEHVGFGVI